MHSSTCIPICVCVTRWHHQYTEVQRLYHEIFVLFASSGDKIDRPSCNLANSHRSWVQSCVLNWPCLVKRWVQKLPKFQICFNLYDFIPLVYHNIVIAVKFGMEEGYINTICMCYSCIVIKCSRLGSHVPQSAYNGIHMVDSQLCTGRRE